LNHRFFLEKTAVSGKKRIREGRNTNENTNSKTMPQEAIIENSFMGGISLI